MAPRFSIEALLFAIGTVFGFSPSPVIGAPAQVTTDADVEVRLAMQSRMPIYGPRYAPVTIDLYLPFGNKVTPANLTLALRLARESPDIRLRYHPVLGSDVAERGAEVLFSIWQQVVTDEGATRCFALAEALAQHPEWLAATPEAESQLLQAARTLGFDAQLLGRALRQRQLRAHIVEMWQSERAEVRSPPELWLNGRRLRGPLTETQLREELDRQRTRAYQALRSGVLLTQLYEQISAQERGDPTAVDSLIGRMGGGMSHIVVPAPSAGLSGAGFDSARPSRVTRLDLSRSPVRGPEVAPVTIVLLGSLDSFGTYLLARMVHEVYSRQPDAVRLVFQHVPVNDGGKRVALLLTQLSLTDPPAFWRAFDGILELMKRRFLLRYADMLDLLNRQQTDVARLELILKDPVQGEEARGLLMRDLAQAQRLGTPGQPMLLVNGRILPSGQSVESLERLVESELSRGVLSRILSRKTP